MQVEMIVMKCKFHVIQMMSLFTIGPLFNKIKDFTTKLLSTIIEGFIAVFIQYNYSLGTIHKLCSREGGGKIFVYLIYQFLQYFDRNKG